MCWNVWVIIPVYFYLQSILTATSDVNPSFGWGGVGWGGVGWGGGRPLPYIILNGLFCIIYYWWFERLLFLLFERFCDDYYECSITYCVKFVYFLFLYWEEYLSIMNWFVCCLSWLLLWISFILISFWWSIITWELRLMIRGIRAWLVGLDSRGLAAQYCAGGRRMGADWDWDWDVLCVALCLCPVATPHIPALLRRAPRASFEPKSCSISVTRSE
jgi:hypothetical protein